MKTIKRLESDHQNKWWISLAQSKAERDRLFIKHANANNDIYNTFTNTTNISNSAAAYSYPPPILDPAKEIAKVKKTVFTLAKLLAAIYDSDESCDGRCGICIPCLVSASLEEITKEEMEALAGRRCVQFQCNSKLSLNSQQYSFTTTTNHT